MSVVGIDFGNLNTVVAVARNRGIDVIVNEVSNRATPSLVSLGEKQRFLGESGKTQENFNFKNTVGSLKRLIGRPFSDPEIMEKESKFINSNLTASKERGEVAASVYYANELHEFTFTELSAMFFSKVKEFTSAEIKVPVSDAVISCPGWFTDCQRRAVIDAAEIAGIHVLRVINDSTAAALGYGITKTDLPDSADAKAKPRTVVFVDMGHSSYQVAVATFVKGKLIIKGTAYDRNLGGRDFDEALTQHFISEFNAKYKMKIESSAKAVFRLRLACEKVKKILSANSVTLLNVECLMDDKDVSAQIDRTQFEDMISSVVERLVTPLQEALDAAGLTIDDVDCVELVGGSTRVPLVKETIAKFFGGTSDNNKLSTTLNQDEAVARGAALDCAIISPVFKVRDFAIQEWNGYPIELYWDESQNPSNAKDLVVMDAFPVGNSVPSTKILTFYRGIQPEELGKDGTVDFTFSARYAESALSTRRFPAGFDTHIGKWTISGIKKLASMEGNEELKATLKIKTKLDADGILSIEAASQIEELVVTEEKKESSTPMETDEPAPPTPAATPELAQEKTKKIVKKHDLKVTASTSACSTELLSKWMAAEGAMAAADRLVIDTADRRNALEEYVYEARSKLDMAWSDFILDSDKTAFVKALNSMEDWLYGEGEDATKSVYSEKLGELRKLGDPVALRYLEAEERPFVEKKMREYINSVLVTVSSGDEKYAHILKEEMEKITNECQKKTDWLNDMIARQNEAPKHATPVVTTEKIKKETESLGYFVNPILNKPKPKVEKPKEPVVEEKTGEKKDESKTDSVMEELDSATAAKAAEEEMIID